MFGNLWQRTKALVTRLLGRAPEPGRFESGTSTSLHGFIRSAPFLWPSRDYLVYIPARRPTWKRAPLLVLCHGCKQTPEEFAQGTRIAAFADRTGCFVLLPRQKDGANAWRCWNWFEARTVAGNGEAAIVAAQIRAVRRHYRIDRKRILVAGMSAGGALAAVIGVRYPGLVAGVAVHSGLACGAAASPMSATTVMRRGPDTDVEHIGTSARAAAAASRLRIPLLAIHGSADNVVAPANAVALVRQYLHLNAHPAATVEHARSTEWPAADFEARMVLPDGRNETIREWRDGTRVVVRHVEISGLGHAWSGGDASLDYNDARMPDATALVSGFFADALS